MYGLSVTPSYQNKTRINLVINLDLDRLPVHSVRKRVGE